MSQYILIAARIDFQGRVLQPETIIDELLRQRMWLLPPASNYIRNLAGGDRFLIYAAGRYVFSATAEAAGPVTALNEDAVPRGLQAVTPLFRYLLRFRRVVEYDEPVSINKLLDRLSFVKNREYWGLHFRQSIRKIGPEDFALIQREAERRR